MQMKKIGYVLLAVLVLLPCIAITAWAQSGALVIGARDVSAEAGETVTVAVLLTENPGVTSVKLSLSYDSAVLVLKKAENGTLFNGWYQASPTTSTLPYLMVWVASEVQSGTGTLILLEFQIADGATVGTVTSPTVCVEEAYCNGTVLSAEPIEFDIEVICYHTYGAYTSVDALTHCRECSKCHLVEPSDHAWNTGVITTPATHLEVGTKTFTCTDCGETRTEDVPKDTAHAYGAWEKHNEAKHKRTCACGEIEYLDHAWNTGVITTPATHLEVGTKTFTCTDCGETRTEEIPKLGKPVDDDPSKNPTDDPSKSPTDDPSKNPTDDPSKNPSRDPLGDDSNAWILPVVIGTLIVCIVAVVVVLLILKRRKQVPAPVPPSPPTREDDGEAISDSIARVDKDANEQLAEEFTSQDADPPMEVLAEVPVEEVSESVTEVFLDDSKTDADGVSAIQASDDVAEKNTEDEAEQTDPHETVSDNDTNQTPTTDKQEERKE